ncbi:hypothetical protein SAY86_021413 [Trapa natans]|uniref:Uncharacterized protein n=1 Tax=Trapa natans TaxID=22666 RepID=A0AAN7RK35_TRANT|nr:hypothetical protein SAY86_021413 [Trapa natans]
MEARKGTEVAVAIKPEETDGEKWVHDSSTDHKGRLPLRVSSGSWRASVFIIAIEFGERLSHFGLATSLVIYLTTVIHQDLKTAAKNVNYWVGVTTLMPLARWVPGRCIPRRILHRPCICCHLSVVNLYFDQYGTGCYLNKFEQGLILLALSWFIPSIKPCEGEELCHKPRCIHEVVFFLAIYLVSIGTGGHKPALQSFGADQFDDDHTEERKSKMSYFSWWSLGLCSGLLVGVTVIVYIQDRVSWGAADILLTEVMALSLVIFAAGRPFYRYRVPTGSPLTPMLWVLVEALAKKNLPYPSDPSALYEAPRSEKAEGRLLRHTGKLK